MRTCSWALAILLAAGSLLAPAAAAPEMSLQARSFRPGELVVVTMTGPPEATSAELRLFDRRVPAHRTSPDRWRAIVGIDLDVTPGEYEVVATFGAAEAQAVAQRIRVVTRSFAVRKLTVNPDFVNPPAAVAQRIEEEARLIDAAYASAAVEPLWQAPFRRPVPHQANSRFGTRSIFNGELRNPHGGTDFLSPSGTPVRAPNVGRVVIARELFFAGRTVLLEHGAGVFSQLAHLSRIDVREGDIVTAGQVVGLVGATGRVTGAHLHWAVRAGGARVDALSLLALLGPEKP